MGSEADRLASLKALGGGARLRTRAGETDCIFDNAYTSVQFDDGIELADSLPAVTITSQQASLLAVTKKGAAIEVLVPCEDSRAFRVKAPRPDGTGMTVLLLETP